MHALQEVLCKTMKHQIYTVGYAGHTPQDLERLAQQLGAHVADIRLGPYSRKPGWNYQELKAIFGDKYHCWQVWGNLNHDTKGPVKIANWHNGLALCRALVAQRPIILFCSCKSYATCHRHIIAQRLIMEGFSVAETGFAAANIVKAVSLHQPWASLMAVGAKGVETRGWATNHRGPLAIHAAKNTSNFALLHDFKFCEPLAAAGLVTYDENYRFVSHRLPLGALVSVGKLVDCRPTASLVKTISERERGYGDYDPGRWGWMFEAMQALPSPIPFRGALQLFDVDAELLDFGVETPHTRDQLYQSI